jgi:hypothetical protein
MLIVDHPLICTMCDDAEPPTSEGIPGTMGRPRDPPMICSYTLSDWARTQLHPSTTITDK